MAVSADSDGVVRAAHANAVAGHVNALAKRDYPAKIKDVINFTMCFVPAEDSLAAAGLRDAQIRCLSNPAILRPVISLASENDPQLSECMSAHLQVLAVTDTDQLSQIEVAVLDILDPLNLRELATKPRSALGPPSCGAAQPHRALHRAQMTQQTGRRQ